MKDQSVVNSGSCSLLTLSFAQTDNINSVVDWLTRYQLSAKDKGLAVNNRHSLR
jgi:hypothetical protein